MITNLRNCWLPALVACTLILIGGCSRQAKTDRALARAEQYFTAGQYDSAEVEYLNVLRLNSSNKVAIKNLGTIYYAQDQVIRALPFLNGLRELDPNNLENRARRARVLMAAGAVKEAREDLEFVLAKDPANETAILLLVDLAAKPEDVKA